MDLSNILPLQAIFLVFYAIFWGAVFNVQARWKAFGWPLFFSKYSLARNRIIFSFLILNVTPIAFFAFAMWALRHPVSRHVSVLVAFLTFARPVAGAFAIFGFYRLWLGVIECFPDCFYASKDNIEKIPEKYRHVEPVYRHYDGSIGYVGPSVELAEGAGLKTLSIGIAYVVIASAILICD